MIKKIIKVVLGFLAGLLIALQFVKADRTNPPVTAEIAVGDDLKNIFKTSCYDCHSNETKWPWYSYVAPISFLIVDDVNEGREKLNFSEWEKYDEAKKNKLKEEIWEEVEKDDMPLPIYTFSHPDSKLDSAKKEKIKNWAFGK
ncbi:MAG: heme-binding domain-containing protein [Melioribacteraceae bacterium]